MAMLMLFLGCAQSGVPGEVWPSSGGMWAGKPGKGECLQVLIVSDYVLHVS